MTMPINIQVAKRVKQLRKKNGLTIEKLAMKSFLSKSCMIYTEKGNRDIKVSTLYSICKALDISLIEFFNFSELDGK